MRSRLGSSPGEPTGPAHGVGVLDPNRDHPTLDRLSEAIRRGTLGRDTIISGPAGTGKTYGILSALHLLAWDWPGLRILICREARASLTESVLVTFEQEVLPADGREKVAQGGGRRFRQGYQYPNGSEIIVGGLDSDTKAFSTAWDIIYVNECIEIMEATWENLGSRLNRPGRVPWAGWLLGDTNPGDDGHWIRQRAKRGLVDLWDTTHKANPALWKRGRWSKEGVTYIARLDRLTGSRYKRLRHGLWVAGEGAWFDGFDSSVHVDASVTLQPGLPVYEAIDSGVHTGAVWFQIDDRWGDPRCWILGDLYLFDVPAEKAARAILGRRAEILGSTRANVLAVTDPAGGASTPFGVTVLEEYERAGLRPTAWPKLPILGGLEAIEALVSDTPARLLIHPRAEAIIAAFGNYKRKQVAGQWIDRPEDPQHPHEDMMDALRGGLGSVLGSNRGGWGRPLVGGGSAGRGLRPGGWAGARRGAR
jgi:hypothetical protein